jgi:uncharacterized protein YlaI
MFEIVRSLITDKEIKEIENTEIVYEFKIDSKARIQFEAMQDRAILEYLCEKCHDKLAGKKHMSITGVIKAIPPEIYYDYTDKIVERDAKLGYVVNRALLDEPEDLSYGDEDIDVDDFFNSLILPKGVL